jgi:hypothetical protein
MASKAQPLPPTSTASPNPQDSVQDSLSLLL